MILSALCTLCLSIEGGIGLQDGFEVSLSGVNPKYDVGNDYAAYVGVIDVTLKHKVIYMQAKHISGMNTEELDGGLNALFAGVEFDHGPWSAQFGGGYQFKSRPDIQSNDYGSFLLTANVQFTFDGIFARREAVGGMDYSILGLSTGWGY